MTIGKAVLVAGVSLILAACASGFQSDVVRFHNLSGTGGESFAIVPTDELKTGSIEFEQYAGMVRAHLSNLGYRAVSENPDITVRVDYYVSDGNEKIRSQPNYGYYSPFYGFGHFGHFGGFGHRGLYGASAFGYPYGSLYGGSYGGSYGGNYSSYTVYTRKLEMDMVRNDGEVIFEGRAESMGRDNRLPEVMPLLVQALFTDFPGESGVTQEVRIKLADRDGY